MKKLFLKDTFQISPKETIQLVSFLGSQTVSRSLQYYNSKKEARATKHALTTIKNFKPKRVLFASLNTGGEVVAVQKLYKKCNIVIAQTNADVYNFLTTHEFIKKTETTLCDETYNTITGHFDLIIFTPNKGVHEELLNTQLQNLNTHLSKDGYFMITVGSQKTIIDITKKYFSPREIKGWLKPKPTLFQRFGRGERTDPLPTYFKSFLLNKEYFLREQIHEPKLKILTHNPDIGTIWSVFPFLHTETYVGDTEPKILDHYPYPRLIQWQPLNTTPGPRKGWIRFPSNLLMTQHGTSPLVPEYWKSWSEQAQRKRSQYLKQSEYKIVTLTLNEYCTHYYESKQPITLKSLLIKQTKDKVKIHGDRVQIWGVVDSKGAICAGLAVLDIPETKTSIHLSAFTLKKITPSFAGTALIDIWYRHGLQQNFTFLDFAIIRSKYDPWSWEGYSIFKKQFAQDLILFKKPLLTFRWPKK